ncbi:hypothetical protein VTL71DRAFT_13053 [Oculimacula yallundae]|uniref:Heterokaryon incompatibility domain-containing protein n=1 Tax=Oculimacula yallundae TaxID=86028 RepID=A0ABR4CQ01_9HELO
MAYQYSPLGLNEFRLLSLHPTSKNGSPSEAGAQIPSISCTLTSHSRDQCPSYIALSYTWGDESNKIRITVNGRSFDVTQNLYLALQYIREETTDVILWIDAMCINQGDSIEKTEQLMAMREIYAGAEHARAWLGLPGVGSDEAFAELNRIGSVIIAKGLVEPMKEFFRLPPGEVERYSVLEKIIKEGFESLVVEAIENQEKTMSVFVSVCEVFSREYWRRLWIVQEIIVSRNVVVQCGKARIDFPILYASVCYLLLLSPQVITWLPSPEFEVNVTDIIHFGIALGTKANSISTSTKLFGARLRYHQDLSQPLNLSSKPSSLSSSEIEASYSRNTLFELLARLHVTGAIKAHCGATEAKDRIFALLGMAKDCATLDIQPDCSRATTCSQIYTKAARAVILSGQVDFLSLAQPQGRTKDLPSWVPDWRMEWILRPSGQLPWDTPFNACPGNVEKSDRGESQLEESRSVSGTMSQVQKPIRIVSKQNQISFHGYLLDTIEEVGRPWTPDYIEGCSGDSHLPAIQSYLSDIIYLCRRSDIKLAETGQDIYPPNTPSYRATAHRRIPIADQEEYGSGFIRQASADSDEAFSSIVNTLSVLISPDDTPVPEDFVREDLGRRGMGYRNMLGWQRDRRPFLAVKGYVGLAPLDTKVGDLVVLFEGAKFPYVLRRGRGNDDELYTLVGEAYVHGVMYGEFLQDRTKGRLRAFTMA